MVPGMLQVFCIDVYALIYPGDVLYFVTPLVSRMFYILPDYLNEPFMVPTPVSESVVEKEGVHKFSYNVAQYTYSC